MISAFKRLVNSNGEANKTGAAGDVSGPNASQIPSQRTGSQAGSNQAGQLLNNGMHMISQSLQKKFSRGVNYNSKCGWHEWVWLLGMGVNVFVLFEY
jgi:membrane protein involved in colicin uptake